MAETQQIVITFKLRAAFEYAAPPPDPIYLFTRFDDRFGRDLPGYTWNSVPEPTANRYESRWRSVFYNEAEALTFLAALTGSAPVAALAASIFRELTPPRTVVTARIYDVRKDGSEIEAVQIAQPIQAQVSTANVPAVQAAPARFNWWILSLGIVFALVWSVWTAWVATWFSAAPARPPPVSVDVSISRSETLALPSNQPHPQQTPRGERACPDCPVVLRIQP